MTKTDTPEPAPATAASPPTLHTARLTLRPHAAADLDAAAALWAHPDVVRHIGGRAFTREEVWQRLLRYRGHWALLGYGYWAVVERASGLFVGEIGLADWKRARLAAFPGVPESGWVLSPDVHGRGYATEALRAVLAWADAALARPSICMITPANAVSIHLARRLGYDSIPDTAGDGSVALFQRPVGAPERAVA